MPLTVKYVFKQLVNISLLGIKKAPHYAALFLLKSDIISWIPYGSYPVLSGSYHQ